MRLTELGKKAVAVAALALTAGAAVAEPVSVGFNLVAVGGSFVANNGDLTSSTAVSLVGGSYFVNGIDVTATTNNVGIALFDPVGLSNPVPLEMDAVFEKTFTTDLGTFTEVLTVTSVDSGPGSRSILAIGTIDDGPGGFDPTTVYFSASYTQNGGPTGQINGSFNNSTSPPDRELPEPTSLALVGLSLAALGLSRRRRG